MEEVLGSPIDLNVHQRYVYIGRALSLTAQPMIKYYYPNDSRSDVVFSQVALWMASLFDILQSRSGGYSDEMVQSRTKLVTLARAQ